MEYELGKQILYLSRTDVENLNVCRWKPADFKQTVEILDTPTYGIGAYRCRCPLVMFPANSTQSVQI